MAGGTPGGSVTVAVAVGAAIARAAEAGGDAEAAGDAAGVRGSGAAAVTAGPASRGAEAMRCGVHRSWPDATESGAVAWSALTVSVAQQTRSVAPVRFNSASDRFMD
ncbi:MAG: hypothetical protein EBS56_03660 [Planctomycetia bacterium]|nr:hypothetical protein [Planctomycetia bacterium]